MHNVSHRRMWTVKMVLDAIHSHTEPVARFACTNMPVEITHRHRAVCSALHQASTEPNTHRETDNSCAESKFVCSHSIRWNDKLVRNSPSAWIIALENGRPYKRIYSGSKLSNISASSYRHHHQHHRGRRQLQQQSKFGHLITYRDPHTQTHTTPANIGLTMHDVPAKSIPFIFHTTFT